VVAALVARHRVEPAVAATLDYVMRTGELPPLVASTLRGFLARKPSVSADDLPAGNAIMPPFSAAALAVWLDPRDRARLAELAHANDVLDRWCEPPAPPARRFAPVLCEPAALAAALRAIDPRDGTAAAIERMIGAGHEVAGVAIETARYAGTSRPDQLELVVELGAEATGAVLGGGAPETPLVAVEGAPRTYRALVPRAIVAPVLRIDNAAGHIRLPAPPFGAP
jgi:hypothetical protein